MALGSGYQLHANITAGILLLLFHPLLGLSLSYDELGDILPVWPHGSKGGGVRLLLSIEGFVSPAPSALPWERRALARLQKPRGSVALLGKPLKHWQWIV